MTESVATRENVIVLVHRAYQQNCRRNIEEYPVEKKLVTRGANTFDKLTGGLRKLLRFRHDCSEVSIHEIRHLYGM